MLLIDGMVVFREKLQSYEPPLAPGVKSYEKIDRASKREKKKLKKKLDGVLALQSTSNDDRIRVRHGDETDDDFAEEEERFEKRSKGGGKGKRRKREKKEKKQKREE